MTDMFLLTKNVLIKDFKKSNKGILIVMILMKPDAWMLHFPQYILHGITNNYFLYNNNLIKKKKNYNGL